MKKLNFNRSFRPFGLLILFAAIILIQGCSKSSPAPNPGPNQVFIQNMAFNPSSITVAVNTTVTWFNKDGVAHTVTSNNGGFDSGNVAAGATYSFKFTTAGSFPYHCSIHANMNGTVVVQ